MSEISMYEAQKKKMQVLCDEHDLVYHSQAHTSHESGVSASGCVAPSPSRHRRAEGGEMRCNRRRRQKVL